MKTTIKAGLRESNYFIIMSSKIEKLRKEIWNTIFKNREDLSECDVAMALSLVNYELIHHIGEK